MASPERYASALRGGRIPEDEWQDLLANQRQFFGDLGRNAVGIGELGLSLGTGMVEQAGKGLGVTAGMLADRLRDADQTYNALQGRGEPPQGDAVDLNAAVEGVTPGELTYAPRTQAGQDYGEAIAGPMQAYDDWMLEQGGKVVDATGSPGLGTAAYTGLSMVDPTNFIPGGMALRGGRAASNVARSVQTPEVRSTGFGGKERGAWSFGDIADVEGDFVLRSPLVDAFDSLKAQEQGRLPGRQLIRALRREGASKEELQWSGLDKLLDTDEVISVADARSAAEQNVPEIEWEVKRGDADVDPDELTEAARERAWQDNDLEYPENYTVRDIDAGEDVGSWDDMDTARQAIEEMIENDLEYYADDFRGSRGEIRDYLEELESRGDFDPADYGDAYTSVSDLPDDVLDILGDQHADDYARSRVDESRYEINAERDYDAEPSNIDELTEYWEGELRSDPQGYGLGVAGPEYGDYTVGRESKTSPDGENYTVALANVLREGRYGRGTNRPGYDGVSNTTEGFVESYLDDPVLRQRELARLDEREDLPDINKARQPHKSSHYGDNILHTREMDYNAPDWGTVQRNTVEGDLPSQAGPRDAYNARVEGQLDLDMDYPAPTNVQTGDTNAFRLLEEAQSDVLQRGRKTGFLYPEEMPDMRANEQARVEAFQRQALDEVPQARQMPEVRLFFDNLEPVLIDGSDVASHHILRDPRTGEDVGRIWPSDFENLNNLRARAERIHSDPGATLSNKLEAEENFWSTLYNTTPSGHPTEAFAQRIMRSLQDLPNMRRSPIEMGVPPSPLSKTPQYMALALRNSLARAVQEGKQYFGWTPGDVHSRRWGSDSIQWARDPNDPNLVTIGNEEYGSRGRGPVEENVRRLRDDPAEANTEARYNLNDPDIEDQIYQLVRQRLSYGMHDFPNPEQQMRKRAQALIESLRKDEAGHYSPRAFGNDMSYGMVEKDMQRLLRESGSAAEIRDAPLGDAMAKITTPEGRVTYKKVQSDYDRQQLDAAAQRDGFTVEYEPQNMRAIEIDPELARAAKRGFKLPY